MCGWGEGNYGGGVMELGTMSQFPITSYFEQAKLAPVSRQMVN